MDSDAEIYMLKFCAKFATQWPPAEREKLRQRLERILDGKYSVILSEESGEMGVWDIEVDIEKVR